MNLEREIERLRNDVNLLLDAHRRNQAWTAYTPTVTPTAGAITSYTATGRYLVIGKLCVLRLSITVANNGTGSGGIQATLPITAAQTAVLAGRTTNTTGNMLQGICNGAVIIIYKYDNTYPGTDAGLNHLLTGMYEI